MMIKKTALKIQALSWAGSDRRSLMRLTEYKISLNVELCQ